MPHVSKSRFRVRYAETDQMGMVYYANYLVWLEVGRSDFCRECGFSYRDLEREEQAFLTVAEAAESPRGIAPRGAHRSVLEPLGSHGSCHPWRAAALRHN